MAEPQSGLRLRQIDGRLRGELGRWIATTAGLRDQLSHWPAAPLDAVQAATRAAGAQLQRLQQEIAQAQMDLTVIGEDLKAAKADAEYREVLVRAWPANHFLDRLTYLGAAVLGAGGAGFILEGWIVASVFWTVGLVLMSSGLYGLRKWERKKWDFCSDQFSIDAKYRPEVLSRIGA
jgi:hypothetical protein